MGDLKEGLQDGRKKDAKDFLGANANLVNLDQLVSKAPPKGLYQIVVAAHGIRHDLV